MLSAPLLPLLVWLLLVGLLLVLPLWLLVLAACFCWRRALRLLLWWARPARQFL
jgi:hypothetical protein